MQGRCAGGGGGGGDAGRVRVCVRVEGLLG